jgi:hypothetical protein
MFVSLVARLAIVLISQVASYSFLVLRVGSWGLGVGRFYRRFDSKLQTLNSQRDRSKRN